MLSLFRRLKATKQRLEIDRVIELRKQVVAELAAAQIDISLENLSVIFGQLEELDAGSKLIALSSDRKHRPLVFHAGGRP